MRTATMGLVLLLLLGSGCAQPDQGPSGTADVVRVDAFDDADDADAGEIVGRILDSEFRPLPEVTVRIVGAKAEASTTQDGIFYFAKVPPRAYTLAYAKNGYEPKNQSVVVQPAARVVVQSMLLQAIDRTPYVDAGFTFRGHINCSVRANASGTNTNPECGQTSAEVGSRQRAVSLLPGVRYLLFEVQWSPTIPVVNEKLRLALRPFPLESWRQIEGTSPIRFMVGADEWASIQKSTEKDYPRFGGQFTVFLFPGEVAASNGLAVGTTIQQDFTVYATAWYNMDAPANFTRLPP